ncbi:MAG: OmpA family protein [Oscillospiraceae bacterium]|nr:OmpA family protein [Oscillospiraceae bacterium]
MMKKSILLLLALSLALCTACGDKGGADADTSSATGEPATQNTVTLDEPYNLVLVAGIVNNNTVVDTSIEEISSLADLPGSTYAFIEADGSPSVIVQGTIEDYSTQGYSKNTLQRVQASVTAELAAQLDAAAPDSAETDLASALSLAVRGLRALEGQENLLVIYHSGISTTGVINMAEIPIYQMDVETSVETVASTLNLDLSGIHIIWYCLGDVGGDQSALSDSEVSTLQSFYEGLFQEMGADSITFMQDLPLADSYSFDQSVSVMETEGTSSGLQAKVVSAEDVEDEDEVEVLFTDGGILSFDEQTIAFLPDSTELADVDAAREALDHIITYMTATPVELLICGTTTSAGEEASCISFSEGRAETVRALLVEAGIEQDRIHILGCGYSSCLYVYDRTADGGLDESVAPQNRTVKMLDYNSDTAAEIISSLSQ